MSIHGTHGKIGKNYGWEIFGLYKTVNFKDHITFFNFYCEWSRNHKYDHSPSFIFELEIFNITIVEISVYYLWHRDDDGNPEKLDESSCNICESNSTSST